MSIVTIVQSRSTNLESSPVVRPLTESFVAEIEGVDLFNDVCDDAFTTIHDAFLQFQVLVFRDQQLTPTRHVEFARSFGEVQAHVLNQYQQSEHPELFFLSNLDDQGQPNGQHPDRGTLYWHTDGSWTRRTTTATLIYSVEVPQVGGETHLADMYRAYELLPVVMKQRIAGIQAVHNLDFSRTRRHGEDPMSESQRKQAPAAEHPIVRTHPETGRKSLFLGDHAEHIVGLDYDEGRALIEELNALATRPELVYRHEWQRRELLVWDNRCVLHRATSFDTARERRVMRRATVLGEISTKRP